MIDAKKLSDGRLAFTPTRGPFGIERDQGYWLTNLQGTDDDQAPTTDRAALPTDHHDYIELPVAAGRPGDDQLSDRGPTAPAGVWGPPS